MIPTTFSPKKTALRILGWNPASSSEARRTQFGGRGYREMRMRSIVSERHPPWNGGSRIPVASTPRYQRSALMSGQTCGVGHHESKQTHWVWPDLTQDHCRRTPTLKWKSSPYPHRPLSQQELSGDSPSYRRNIVSNGADYQTNTARRSRYSLLVGRPYLDR